MKVTVEEVAAALRAHRAAQQGSARCLAFISPKVDVTVERFHELYKRLHGAEWIDEDHDELAKVPEPAGEEKAS